MIGMSFGRIARPGAFEIGCRLGERGRDRTCDPRIKSAMLYRLSYAPTVFDSTALPAFSGIKAQVVIQGFEISSLRRNCFLAHSLRVEFKSDFHGRMPQDSLRHCWVAACGSTNQVARLDLNECKPNMTQNDPDFCMERSGAEMFHHEYACTEWDWDSPAHPK